MPTDIKNIALVRFSALGDVTLVVPAVHCLQQRFPNATLTWITSPLSYSLLQGLPGVNFEVYEKPRSWSDYRAFYRAFNKRSFDVVLAMQASLRINLLYPALHAPVKIGFDRTRAREGQWLFCNVHIPYANNHLLDSFMAFATQLGAAAQPVTWEFPISDADRSWAREQLEQLPQPVIAIHPVASKTERTWLLDRYAELMQTAAHRWGAGLVLTGGNAPLEQEFCARLANSVPRVLNLCGHTTPKQLAALLGQVDVLVAPDTGPVHLATAMHTPVVGLYAVAPPGLSGPYARQQFSVNRYPEAVRKFLNQDPSTVAWNTRVHHAQAMVLIQTEDVLQQLAKVLGHQADV
ncbi:MAG: glycosyltransferase family 9 protein [Gallionellaceae bacterium]|nr:glycosyltransferase family 9 protein [Gallionellaceae bacterium]